jgi:hypothetical protein
MDVNVQVRIDPPDNVDEDADEFRRKGLCHVTLYHSLRYRPLYSLLFSFSGLSVMTFLSVFFKS